MFLLLSLDSRSQTTQKKFEFIKVHQAKPVFLKEGKSITVVTKMITYLNDTSDYNFEYNIRYGKPPTWYETNSTRIYGRLIELTDSFLIISCNFQITDIEFNQDSSVSIQRDYSNLPAKIKIPLNKIDHINYDGKGSNIFLAGMITSYVTLFILAPLISYNYGSGTFNGGLYINIVKYSALATLLTEIPYIMSTPKKCRVKN